MIVVHVLAPAPVGGLETVVQTLAIGSRARGADVHVAPVLSAHEAESHPFLAPLIEYDVPVHPIVVGNRAYLQEWRAIRELVTRLGADVVHTHGYRSDIIARSAAGSAATVATVHGFTGGGLRNRVYEAIQERSFRSFDAVVAVSNALQKRLVNAGVPRSRLHVIQNAWAQGTQPLSRSHARARLGIAEGSFAIGWVGRLSQEKGADVLLNAVAELPESARSVTFIGDGPERNALEQHAHALGVESRVQFKGNVMNGAALFAAFDVFVLSSRTEGTPMVLFEAMAAGVPIVATRVGGVPDVIDESNGLLVPSENPAALAAAIMEVRNSRERSSQRTAQGRHRLETQFAREPWLDKYDALYHELRTNSEVECHNR